jgi:PAS domain S-box-containing protein
MKLRIILLVLSSLAFLSISIGVYLYYSYSKESAFKEADRQAALHAQTIKNHLSSFVSENIKSVRTLAGLKEQQQALVRGDNDSLAKANSILDHFNDALDADVCYLMDHDGNAIASSNRYAPDSFVGENYAFRPYYRQAMQGTPSVYMALGITSKKRGVYYSCPVYGKGQDTPIGVVVIKTSIEPIEEEFNQAYEGIVMLTDPRGVVFLSSRKEWLYHTLRKLSPQEISQIAVSQQFGEGPWDWTGLEVKDRKHAVDDSGDKYFVHRVEIDNYPGWDIIFLRSVKAISKKVYDPLIRPTGYIILALCVLVGLSVFYLYKKASYDIIQRKAAEEALLESEETKRALLNAPTDRALLLDNEGTILALNTTAAQALGKNMDELIGLCAFDLFPSDITKRRKAYHDEVIRSGKPVRYEDEREGSCLDTTVYPIFDALGKVVRVAIFSRDITERKRAEEELKVAKEELSRHSKDLERQVTVRTDQLRRLSRSIMVSQEKERAAIARELHDELGQVLTALRIDSVRLWERMKDTDAKAAERALTMCELIDKTIDEVQAMAVRLRPGVLDDLGLIDALEWYCIDFGKRIGITCNFKHLNVPKVNDLVATAAYRITQETLTNVARHSLATRVDVALQAQDGILTLVVSDNGRGFNTLELAGSKALGIAGMRERASLIGGTMKIQSELGKGTQVYFRVPIDG